MKFLIAGGGIGGLTAAVGLSRLGHDVQLLEQMPTPKPIGAGISLQPNAMQALAELDLAEPVKQRGYASTIAQITHSNGRPVQEMNFEPYEKEFGFLPYTIHRAALFDVLFNTAKDNGVVLEFGQPLESFGQRSHSVEVLSESGKQYSGDALIGADGINSRVRVGLWGDRPKRYSGYVCWRGIVDDPEVVASVDTMNEIWGVGARFGYMRCSASEVYWFATATTKDKESAAPGWQSRFEDWPGPVSRLIANTPADRIAFNDISDRKPIFPWSKGRVTLLGDAAHPMTPNFGQGGAQAIEDAVILTRAIERASDPAVAFVAYENHRHTRTHTFVNGSWQFGRVAQAGSALTRLVRNQILPMMPNFAIQKKLAEQFDFRSHLAAF